MAFIHFLNYTPCAFVIVRDGGNPQSESDSVLIQTDWDYPGVANCMGWAPCHPETDGTIDCPECGVSASSMIMAASEHIREHAGESFPQLDDYFGG
jgi:hypothetical protein